MLLNEMNQLQGGSSNSASSHRHVVDYFSIAAQHGVCCSLRNSYVYFKAMQRMRHENGMTLNPNFFYMNNLQNLLF